jgi:hypothetical protein
MADRFHIFHVQYLLFGLSPYSAARLLRRAKDAVTL